MIAGGSADVHAELGPHFDVTPVVCASASVVRVIVGTNDGLSVD